MVSWFISLCFLNIVFNLLHIKYGAIKQKKAMFSWCTGAISHPVSTLCVTGACDPLQAENKQRLFQRWQSLFLGLGCHSEDHLGFFRE